MVDLLIDFRSRGWSGSAETVGPWNAIQCQALGAGWTRGSSEHRGLLNLPEAAEANVQLWDPERTLDPANTAGPWFGQIDVGADLRLTFGGRVVFLGRITTLDHKLEAPTGIGDPVAIASIQSLEYQGRLATTDLFNQMWPNNGWITSEVTSARINRILDAAGIPTGAGSRDIEAGGQMLYDYEFEADTGMAWDQLVLTMRGELGSIEYTNGIIRTRNRTTLWGTPPAASLQLGCHAGAIPIYDAEFATLRNTVRNSIQANVPNNSQLVGPVTDATSQAKYGLRTFNEDDITIHKDGLETWKAFFLSRMKAPMRSWRVTVRPTTQATIDAIETVPLYVGRARLTIDQHGPDIDKNLRVIGMEWNVDPDGCTAVIVLGDEP